MNRSRWERHLHALHTFIAREGHAAVPANHIEHVGADDVPLGSWVGYVRQRYRKGLLSPARIDELAGLAGWSWGPLRPGPDPEQVRNAEIRALRAQKLSLREIGDRYGLSRQRVHQIVGKLERVDVHLERARAEIERAQLQARLDQPRTAQTAQFAPVERVEVA